MVTGGSAVTAMVRHGLSCVNQPLSLVPRFFRTTRRRVSSPPGSRPSIAMRTRGDAPWIGAMTMGHGLSRRMAATAAPRRGLAPTLAPLDRTRCPVDGRYHRAAEPDAEVIHRPRGDRRELVQTAPRHA